MKHTEALVDWEEEKIRMTNDLDREIAEALRAVVGHKSKIRRMYVFDFQLDGDEGNEYEAAQDQELAADPSASWKDITDRAADQMDCSRSTILRHGYSKDPRDKTVGGG